MKPTLLVLAAGMGSRYGGLKQMDGLGPNGETIIDYSIYDAVEAGFGKVVYIVREYFKEQMEQVVREKYSNVKCVDGEPLEFSLSLRNSTRFRHSSHSILTARNLGEQLMLYLWEKAL